MKNSPPWCPGQSNSELAESVYSFKALKNGESILFSNFWAKLSIFLEYNSIFFLEESITTVELNFEKWSLASSFPSSMTTKIGISKCNSFIFLIHSTSAFVKITADTSGKSVSFISISSRFVWIGNIFLADSLIERGLELIILSCDIYINLNF